MGKINNFWQKKWQKLVLLEKIVNVDMGKGLSKKDGENAGTGC